MVSFSALCIAFFYIPFNFLRRKKQLQGEAYNFQAELEQKYNLYLELSKTQQDQDGFIEWDTGDSLIFSGLYGAVGGKVDLTAARDSDGKWHRRSLNQPPVEAASSISRDCFIGVLWWMWRGKRLAEAEELFEYGKSHSWIMGEGDVSRIYFTPGLQATLAELIYRLGGKNHWLYRSIPQVYSKNVNYAAHLDMLHILLRGEMRGYLDYGSESIIQYNYYRVSANPFFSYIYHHYFDGNHSGTVWALLNPIMFPTERLPTTHDYCDAWITQRDGGADWQPCGLASPPKTHSGGDFIFTAGLLLRK